jgi:hypothetical protein
MGTQDTGVSAEDTVASKVGLTAKIFLREYLSVTGTLASLSDHLGGRGLLQVTAWEVKTLSAHMCPQLSILRGPSLSWRTAQAPA